MSDTSFEPVFDAIEAAVKTIVRARQELGEQLKELDGRLCAAGELIEAAWGETGEAEFLSRIEHLIDIHHAMFAPVNVDANAHHALSWLREQILCNFGEVEP